MLVKCNFVKSSTLSSLLTKMPVACFVEVVLLRLLTVEARGQPVKLQKALRKCFLIEPVEKRSNDPVLEHYYPRAH